VAKKRKEERRCLCCGMVAEAKKQGTKGHLGGENGDVDAGIELGQKSL